MRSRHEQGFTLLEVMVALTITGLALGGLFGVIAGSKRLAWRAEQTLVHSSQVRSLINFSQLNNEQGEVFISFENDDLTLVTGTELQAPERQTAATNEELRGYEITDENGEVVASGTYWMFPELPSMPPSQAGGLGQQGAVLEGVRSGSSPLNTPSIGIRGLRDPTGNLRGADERPNPQVRRPFQ